MKETLVKFWYQLVASSLIRRYENQVGILRTQLKETKVLLGLSKQDNVDVKRDNLRLKLRIRELEAGDPQIEALNNTRHRAAQARIRDLEAQLTKNGIKFQ